MLECILREEIFSLLYKQAEAEVVPSSSSVKVKFSVKKVKLSWDKFS